MGAVIITVVVLLVVLAGSYLGVERVLRKRGIKTMREQSPARRWMFWLAMGVTVVMAAFEGWAFSTHHTVVGVIVLVALVVVPEAVLIPLSIRRSRRAAQTKRKTPAPATRAHRDL